MVIERPPPHPPDPLTHCRIEQSETVVNMVMHLRAKNASDSCQNGKDLYKIRIPAAAVTFEAAAKQANALHSPLLHSVSSVSDRVDFISSEQYYDYLFEVYPSTTE